MKRAEPEVPSAVFFCHNVKSRWETDAAALLCQDVGFHVQELSTFYAAKEDKGSWVLRELLDLQRRRESPST